MANNIDRYAGNSVVRQRGSHRKRCALLAVSKAVAENRHRPAIGWTRPGRDEQVEEYVFRTLCWDGVACSHLRNKYAGILPVLPGELPECDRSDGTREYLQGSKQRIQAGWNERAYSQGLQ